MESRRLQFTSLRYFLRANLQEFEVRETQLSEKLVEWLATFHTLGANAPLKFLHTHKLVTSRDI